MIVVVFFATIFSFFTVATMHEKHKGEDLKPATSNMVITYEEKMWGVCDFYYDKNGCLKMRRCKQKSKSLPSIWTPKDGVCSK